MFGRRMVEQRQIAERQRVAGNAAFKDGQYSEALRCYQLGIDAQKISMTLHGNAAMAALKLNCFVQAIEHCDKVSGCLMALLTVHGLPAHIYQVWHTLGTDWGDSQWMLCGSCKQVYQQSW